MSSSKVNKNKVITISWKRLHKDAKILTYKITQNEIKNRKRYSGIYGIPRNGTLIAVILSHLTQLPWLERPERSCLVVDDCCDSGETLSNNSWKGLRLSYQTAVLYRKDATKHEPDFYVRTINKWIKLPFETKESSKIDYKERRK